MALALGFGYLACSPQVVPIELAGFVLGWIATFSVICGVLAIELVVDLWPSERDLVARLHLLVAAVGISTCGFIFTISGALGSDLQPELSTDPYSIVGALAGAVCAAGAWTWHFIRKRAAARSRPFP